MLPDPSSNAQADEAASREIAPLVTAYLEVVIGAGGATVQVALAVAAARALTGRRLRALALAVADPMPWLPFIRVLAAVPEDQQTTEQRDGLTRLWDLACGMLRATGLGVLRPEDLVLTEGPLERAASGLSPSRHELNTHPLPPR